MRVIKYLILLGVIIVMFEGCTKQIPQDKIQNIKLKKRVGILSNIGNDIFIHKSSLFSTNVQQVKTVKNWDINSYVEKSILDKFKIEYKNVDIVKKNSQVVLLRERLTDYMSPIKNIMNNQSFDLLIVIDNNILKSKYNYKPGLNYYKSNNISGNYDADYAGLNISVKIIEKLSQENIKVISGKSFYMNKFILTNDNSLISLNDGNINEVSMSNMELLFKDLIKKEIIKVLSEFELINNKK